MTALAAPNPAFDDAAAEHFASRVGELLDAGATSAMVSVGHRLRLFDTLAGLPPARSDAIAAAAGLAERYVREWLAVMVVAGIVDYEPAGQLYVLPPEHAASLTDGAALGNLAVYAQHVALLGKVEDRIVRCLETGEGTAYGDYPCFHQIMAEDSAQTVLAGLFDAVLPLIDGLEERLATGIDVLDAGCGRGAALRVLAERFPSSRFVGYDLCADAIAFANASAADRPNLHYEVRDLAGYAEPARWDLVTSFDAVHDQKDPQSLIHGLKASLRPGGTYLLQDIGGSARLENNRDFPMAAMLYAISVAHCTPISIGQGGPGLGTMWGWETAQQMLERAGFVAVTRHVLPHDPMNVWFVART